MGIEIRRLAEGEADPFLVMTSTAFGRDPRLSDRDMERRLMTGERVLVAADGDQIVAGAASTPFQLTVPGGSMVRCAGITSVATLPTHRRRGLSRTLMLRQLEESRDAGETAAYLWASEAAIYQRFGFGHGAMAGAFKIKQNETGFLQEVRAPGHIRLAEREEALKLLPDIYDRVRPTRPGMIDRPPEWQAYCFRDEERDREGASPMLFAIYEASDGPRGYAAYRVKPRWGGTGPDHELIVEELLWDTDDAYAALWRFCFDIDLVRTITGWKRPVDEPLLHMLLEPRALRFKLHDGTWLRLVDVAAALEARRYSHDGGVVLEVDDEFAPWNDGTYELEGGPEGATCRPTGAQPDLSMRVEDLAAAYLGAASFRALAAAGRVAERNPGALSSADAMFSSAVAPWCPWIF